MKVRFVVEAEFDDGWCEQEARSEIVSAVTSELFDRNASQVTISRES